ncbi:MAG: Txe/YoeB family addiction module toxin [Bacteroidales bacterium]|nr:Txe/YoeB family addiction module toxin [Bacteroidales bacterium]
MVNVVFTDLFLKDFKKHKKDKEIKSKILDLISDMNSGFFDGIGKPECLKNKEGMWSRHITDKHRLTYTVNKDVLYLHSCYGHYNDK